MLSISTETILQALGGGALIGLASALLLLSHGKVAGISGILGGLLDPATQDRGYRLAFLAGLIRAGLLVRVALPAAFAGPGPTIGFVAVAGLLVGFGTRLGNGCTSGHGVCGISRLSRRSIVATVTFIATGALGVLLAKSLG